MDLRSDRAFDTKQVEIDLVFDPLTPVQSRVQVVPYMQVYMGINYEIHGGLLLVWTLYLTHHPSCFSSIIPIPLPGEMLPSIFDLHNHPFMIM